MHEVRISQGAILIANARASTDRFKIEIGCTAGLNRELRRCAHSGMKVRVGLG
jgi:hypothetical protein